MIEQPAEPAPPGPVLAEPDAPVSVSERLDFQERNAYWILDWERFAGRAAVEDQVRFDREWGALRRYATERGVRLFGDVAIYPSSYGYAGGLVIAGFGDGAWNLAITNLGDGNIALACSGVNRVALVQIK